MTCCHGRIQEEITLGHLSRKNSQGHSHRYGVTGWVNFSRGERWGSSPYIAQPNVNLQSGCREGSVDGKFLRGNARDREFWQTSEDSC